MKVVFYLKVNVADSDVSKGLTLLRLLLWFKEPIENLKLAASLVDVAKGKNILLEMLVRFCIVS